ncbi:MAG: flavin reductase [Eubacteriales bacterium]|nr:flavin reductase [Eubacteriales bacterium]
MRFAIAVRGAEVANNMEACDTFVIYEEKHGRIIMRQNIENTRVKSLPLFLKEFQVSEVICNGISEEEKQRLCNAEIGAITGLTGEFNVIAEKMAYDRGKKHANMKSCLQPMPKVLVSCRGLNGENNVLAVGYCGNCSYSPPMVMVGIVPSRYSYQMIKESGCFVVNLVDERYQETFDYLGCHSKRDEDKLSAMNVQLANGKTVNAPILTDCPVNIECTVVDSIVTGSHEMFIGKVEYVHADASIVDKEGNIDFSTINFIK